MAMEGHIYEDRNRFAEDILRILEHGSHNDVKIRLCDGQISANKDILMSRSEYFATMFSNSRFIEGETSSVDMSHCSKAVMEKIIKFFFSGTVKFYDLSLTQLLELSHMTEMMLLDKFKEEVDFCFLKRIDCRGDDVEFLPELIRGLKLADQYNHVDLKDEIMMEIYSGLKVVPKIPEDNSGSFKKLDYKLVKDVFLCGSAPNDRQPTAIECLNAFMHWLSSWSNWSISAEQKAEVVESFDFEDFSVEELLTTVRDSGLFSVKKIDERVLALVKVKENLPEMRQLNEIIENVERFIPEVDLSKIRRLLQKIMGEKHICEHLPEMHQLKETIDDVWLYIPQTKMTKIDRLLNKLMGKSSDN